MTDISTKRGGRGGRRAGAGRPPTYRRVTIDAEAAEQLGALLQQWRAERTPEEPRLTASSVVSELITDAWWRAIGQYAPEEPER